MLEISHFTKRFGDTIAVDNLSFVVPEGKIVAFIGHNGAGKSTTLRACAGIIDFDAGSITVTGHNIRNDALAAKRQSAFLPDNPDLYDFMSAIEYLTFVADLYEMPQDVRQERIAHFASAFALDENLRMSVGSFSHGMKQKLALVSAFMRSPRLLMLDEPFVGLDPVASHTLKTLLRQLCNDGGAVLYSTHVLDVAQSLCDDVVIIKQGRLVVSGNISDVIGDSSLEQVFLELEGALHEQPQDEHSQNGAE